MQAFLAKSGAEKKASRVPFRLSKSTETAFPASESVSRDEHTSDSADQIFIFRYREHGCL